MFVKTLTVVASAVLLVGGTAAPGVAATPKAGTFSQMRQNGDYKIRLEVNKAKSKVSPFYYNDCSNVPVVLKIRIKDDGSFTFNGTRDNVIGDPVHVFIKGKFVRPKVAKGSVQYTSNGCSAAKEDFKAKWHPSE